MEDRTQSGLLLFGLLALVCVLSLVVLLSFFFLSFASRLGSPTLSFLAHLAAECLVNLYESNISKILHPISLRFLSLFKLE